uniref:Uncharacterized protein n=1 Tax=Alexandrium catenella TaxID=2925 RepID=A0A7S1QRU0_ALECA|mmetsp:Transcript_37693/g.101999  ORF Transcript_37693/g.101999 Transcript_37693/m.101999 type:complete len:195 (+) Transcript_37693:118-702(+)
MPLLRSWTLWQQTVGSGYDPQRVVAFSTAQEFWAVWNGVPQPSEMLEGKVMREQPDGQSLAIDAIMIFSDRISPEWEHAANAKGGHFAIELVPHIGGGQIDEYWNRIVLAVIGESMESSDIITGLRLVDKLSGKRKVSDRIRLEVWYHSRATIEERATLLRGVERALSTRLDGSLGPALREGTISDKKHGLEHW